jgi:hypothetical protein
MGIPSTARVLILVGLIAFASVACGGSRGAESERAQDAARAALIDETALPGFGWTAGEVESVVSSPPRPESSGPCLDLEAPLRAALEAASEKRIAGGQRQISKQLPDSPWPLTVQVRVEVFDDTATPVGLLAALRVHLEAPAYASCLADRLGFEPGLEVAARRVRPLAPRPDAAVASAVEIEIREAASATVTVARSEGYQWAYGRVLVSVELTGPRHGFSQAVVTSAVLATEEAVEAALADYARR